MLPLIYYHLNCDSLPSQCTFQPSLYHAKQGTPHFKNPGAKVHLKDDHQEGQKIYLPTGSRSTRPVGKPVDMARIVGSGSDDSYALYPARAAKNNQHFKEAYSTYCEQHAATAKTAARIAAFGFELGSAVKPAAYAAYRRITLEDERAKASLAQAQKMGCTFAPKTTLSDPVMNAEFEQVRFVFHPVACLHLLPALSFHPPHIYTYTHSYILYNPLPPTLSAREGWSTPRRRARDALPPAGRAAPPALNPASRFLTLALSRSWQIYGAPRAERCADFAVPHRNVDSELGVDGMDGSADVVTRLYNDAVYLRGKWVKKDATTGEVIVGEVKTGQRVVVAQEAKGKLDKRRQELHSEKLTRSKPDISATREYVVAILKIEIPGSGSYRFSTVTLHSSNPAHNLTQ